MTLARILTNLCAAVALVAAASGASQAGSRTDIKEIVVEEALATTVPPSLALAVAKVESDFQVRALSPRGARGVMQIMPATAQAEFGVTADELWKARLNVQLGVDFLARLIERYDGRWDLALSHYNGGRVMGAGDRAASLPAAQGYIAAVLRWQRLYAAQARVWRATTKRVAANQHPPAAHTTIVRARPDHAVANRFRTGAHDLDDFGGSIERRRRRVGPLLDDLTAVDRPGES